MVSQSSLLCLLTVVILLFNFGRSELVHVHVVYRHGDRSPIRIFPKSEHKQDAWPMGLGQLTPRGMRQHFALGTLFNELYGNGRFLNTSYRLPEIRVRSTDYERTLMSSYCNLAGFFYPQNPNQRWNVSIPWTPVPVHTIPMTQDIMLVENTCPRYDQLEDDLINSPVGRLVTEEYRDIFQLLDREAGLPDPVTLHNIWQIQDQLYCEEQHRMRPPTWYNATVRHRMNELNDFGWRLKYYNDDLARLRAGVLLDTIAKHMQEIVLGSFNLTSGQKMIVYSSHDTDVAALLSALRVFNGLHPPYASSILLELHRMSSGESKSWFVNVLLHNSSVNEDYRPGKPILLTIPKCDTQCPFDKFLQLVDHNRLSRDEYNAACQAVARSPPSFVNKSAAWEWKWAGGQVTSIGLVSLCVAGMCGILLLVAVFLWRKMKVSRRQDTFHAGSYARLSSRKDELHFSDGDEDEDVVATMPATAPLGKAYLQQSP